MKYGVYDLTYNEGWVLSAISHDTAEFARAAYLSGGIKGVH